MKSAQLFSDALKSNDVLPEVEFGSLDLFKGQSVRPWNSIRCAHRRLNTSSLKGPSYNFFEHTGSYGCKDAHFEVFDVRRLSARGSSLRAPRTWRCLTLEFLGPATSGSSSSRSARCGSVWIGPAVKEFAELWILRSRLRVDRPGGEGVRGAGHSRLHFLCLPRCLRDAAERDPVRGSIWNFTLPCRHGRESPRPESPRRRQAVKSADFHGPDHNFLCVATLQSAVWLPAALGRPLQCFSDVLLDHCW